MLGNLRPRRLQAATGRRYESSRSAIRRFKNHVSLTDKPHLSAPLLYYIPYHQTWQLNYFYLHTFGFFSSLVQRIGDEMPLKGIQDLPFYLLLLFSTPSPLILSSLSFLPFPPLVKVCFFHLSFPFILFLQHLYWLQFHVFCSSNSPTSASGSSFIFHSLALLCFFFTVSNLFHSTLVSTQCSSTSSFLCFPLEKNEQ